MEFILDEVKEEPKTLAKLKVVGVGGAGGNAVNRMVQSGLHGVEFIAVNTDAMSLSQNQAHVKIRIGTQVTAGLGAGANPQVGMLAMQEDRDALRERLQGADMLFIAAGMGGGTGTGAGPVVAELARELGILTVAVVTKPFLWEGAVRERNAQAGLDALRRSADTVIVVPNQKLLSVVEKNTPLKEAFKVADEVLGAAVRGISDIILKPGLIQVDFADVRTVMAQGGDALMGMGAASGENRATIAMDRAIHSPLLENINIAGATSVLVNFTGGEDLALSEIHEAMNSLFEAVGSEANANIIFGTVIHPEMKEEVSVTVIATGFGAPAGQKSAARPAAEPLRRTAPPDARPMGIPSGGAEPPERIERPLREELTPTDKVPFGARLPQRPVYGGTPPVRAEESRSVFHEAGTTPDAGRRSSLPNLFSAPQRGRYSESSPDVDYETPAFLRNQAD